MPVFKENGRRIAHISIPVLLERTSLTFMNVVSMALTAMLGSVAISAFGLVHAIYLALLLGINALAVGGTVAVARAYGRKDSPGIGAAAIQSIMSITVLGILVTVVVWLTRYPVIYTLYGGADPAVLESTMILYSLLTLSIPLWSYISIVIGVLRGVGDTKTTMFVSILMGAANLVLTYVFIKGLHVDLGLFRLDMDELGIRGPGLGILFSRLIGAVVVTIPLLRSRHGQGRNAIRMGRLLAFRPDIPVLKAIYGIAVPASAEQLIFEVGKVLTQTIIVGLGTVSLAANTIAWSILSILNMPGGSAMTSTTTLVGQTVGEGSRTRSRAITWAMTGLVIAANVVVGIALLILLKPVIGIYSPEAAVYPIVRTLLLTLIIPITFLWPAGYITAAGLRAAGDVRYVMVVSIVSMWIMRVGGAFLFIKVLDMGILGLWISMYMDWFARVVFFSWRVKGEKWFARSGI